jgi:hypothetical protein
MTSGDNQVKDTFAYHLAQGIWPPEDAYIAPLKLDATHLARRRRVAR